MNKLTLYFSGIFLLVIALYFLTLHPFFPLGDSGEFVVAAKTTGVSHPPGAPFNMLLSYLFANVNIGNLVVRMNILSATFGALATAFTFLLVYEMTKKYIVAAFAGVLLGISHLFWLYAIFPEVYSLSIFLNVVLLYLYAKWSNTHRQTYLYAMALCAGLSLSVHYVNIVTIFLIGLFILPKTKKELYTIKNLLFILGSFLIGLLPILSIPIAASHHPYSNWGSMKDISSFLSFLLRTDFSIIGQSESFKYPLALAFKEQIPFWGKAMYASVGPAIALLLFALMIEKKKRHFLFVILANAVAMGPMLVLFENYPLASPYPDVALNHSRLMQQVHIFALPYVIALIGLGLGSTQEKIEAMRPWKGKLFIQTMSLLVLAALLSLTLWVNYQKIASARNDVFKTYGENIMQTIHKPTLLITGTEESNILDYLYTVERRKRQNTRLITFSLMQHTGYVEELKKRYPDVYFPFNYVLVGQKLDDFYEKTCKTLISSLHLLMSRRDKVFLKNLC